MFPRHWLALCTAALVACGHSPDQTQPVPDSGPPIPHGCVDNDGDGYKGTGDCSAVPKSQLDCNDNDPTIHPGATERCNGKDDNCDGQIDEGNPGGGIACTARGADGGALLGACGQGTTACEHDGGFVGDVCEQTHFPTAEICNGLDDDCDGNIDNQPGTPTALSQACYDGAAGTKGVGVCVGGTQTCEAGSWGRCLGEVIPSPEQCNGLDDDCDGRVDNVPGTQSPLIQSCFGADAGSAGVGVCKAGSEVCDGGSWGACVGEVLPTPETCNGLDDDCDGNVDNLPGTTTPISQACYTGPVGTEGVGVCAAGASSCVNAVYGPCTGQVLPTSEVCNGLDDDCDGRIDNVPGGSGPLTQACYTGPSGTEGVGVCVGGTQTCSGGAYGACAGQVVPSAEVCNGRDDDCDGNVDNVAGTTNPLTQACYTGPSGTQGVGVCVGGTQTCSGGAYGTCAGQVLPSSEVCNSKDDDCDGHVDNVAGTTNPLTQSCYDGPSGTAGVGVCKSGTASCTSGVWGNCAGEVLPQPPACDGLDNDCNGLVDEPYVETTWDVDGGAAWTDLAVAPFYYSAGGCKGGTAGSGSDALQGGILVGTNASGLFAQKLDATGTPVGDPIQIEPYTYDVVGVAQAGNGFIVAGIYAGLEIDLVYVDPNGNFLADNQNNFYAANDGGLSNTLDSLRVVRGNGKRVTLFWREGSPPNGEASAAGIQTVNVAPFQLSDAGWAICDSDAGSSCASGANLGWLYWPLNGPQILAGLGADSTHVDWTPTQTCQSTSTQRKMAVAYLTSANLNNGNCTTSGQPCVAYYDILENASTAPSNNYPGTGMYSPTSPTYLSEPELLYYLPDAGASSGVDQWFTAWVQHYPQNPNTDLDFWMTSNSTQGWDWAYLTNATDPDGGSSAKAIARPRATVSPDNHIQLTALRLWPDPGGKVQMMSRRLLFYPDPVSGTVRDPSSDTVEISATTGTCGPPQCRPGNKGALANWAAQQRIFYNAQGSSPTGTYDSLLTCN